MPVTHTRPYYIGETALLAAPDPQIYQITVTSPDGNGVVLQRQGSNPVSVLLNSVGVWRYQWAGTDEQTFEVVAPPSLPSMATPSRSSSRRWPPPRGV